MRILEQKGLSSPSSGGPTTSPQPTMSFPSQKKPSILQNISNFAKGVYQRSGIPTAISYEKNRVFKPAIEGVKQIYNAGVNNKPNRKFGINIPTKESLIETGKGALNLLGAGFNQTPTGAGFNAMLGAPKAYSESYRKGGSLAENIKSAEQGFTGEKEVGLGEALTSNPTAQKWLDYAEFPIMLALLKKTPASKAKAILESGKVAKEAEVGAKVVGETGKVIKPQPLRGATKGVGKVLSGEPKMAETKLLAANLESPEQKIIQAINKATPLTEEQRALYTKARSERFAKSSAITTKGEAGFYAEKGALKGEMPKVEFAGIKNQLTKDDVDSLFKQVRDSSNLTYPGTLSGREGLVTILEGGVPVKSQLAELSKVFSSEFLNAVLNKRSTWTKILDFSKDAINVPRAIMASFDFSAYRQAVFSAARHPGIFGKAFKGQFKQAFSEKAFQDIGKSIESRPNAALYNEYDLGLTGIGKLAVKEEAFATDLAGKIPLVGKIIKGSNRAYVGLLRTFRADLFDDMLLRNPELKSNPTALKELANLINNGTGRGDLPGFMKASAPLINGTLFSPRLMSSRLRLLNPFYYTKLTKLGGIENAVVRKEALKSLFSFAATGMSVLGLAKAAGAEVGIDPRSADFGKIKVGNTRYDIFGGFQQYIRFATQMLTGETVSTTTGKVTKLGQGYKPTTRKDVLTQFAEYKTAPVLSFALALLEGQDFAGKPLNVPKEVALRFVPLVIQDMYDLMQEEDFITGLGMTIPGIFGVGVQTYAGSGVKIKKNSGKASVVGKTPTMGNTKTAPRVIMGTTKKGPTLQPKK
jgi:hypothetical protein